MLESDSPSANCYYRGMQMMGAVPEVCEVADSCTEEKAPEWT
ncbi:hypothetical protein SHXM_06859 [Streptomyces hygroscopicus]|nr:hypothetical protein SHXM_06859 [Streptomyces hygroscopicus]